MHLHAFNQASRDLFVYKKAGSKFDPNITNKLKSRFSPES